MFLILGALRGFNRGMTLLRRGQWRYGVGLAHDPQGKILGILGMGGIGRTVMRRALAFDMKVQYHNRNRLEPHLEGNARYVSFDELLATSDVISVNLPLNVRPVPSRKPFKLLLTPFQAHTRHILSRAEFAKMKKGVVIVNTARGAV